MASSTENWAALTPADFLRSLRRRAKSLVLTAVAVTVLIAGLLILWPNRYASEGMLFVRLGRGSVSLDPTTTASATVSLQESRTAEVASVREMLASRAIAERVVDRVGVEEILRPRTRTLAALETLTGWLPSLSSGGASGDDSMSAEQYAAAIRREEAIQKLRSNLDVTVPRNAYNVIIEAKMGDPVLARDVVQSAMEAYSVYHIEAHSATGSLPFFEAQHQAALECAMTAQQTLRDAKNRMGLLSAQSQEATLQARISKLELDHDQTLSDLADALAEVEGINNQLASLNEWIPTTTTKGVANSAGDGMRQALYELEIKERETLSKLSPNHPRYRAIQQQVEQSTKIVKDQASERPLTVEALNPIRQTLEAASRTGIGQIAGLRARQRSLEKNLAETESLLQQLNEHAVELSELRWAAEVAEANYLKQAKSLEEARVLTALDRQEMSDVSIIQPASLMLKKVGPQRTLLLLIGGMLGLCLGSLQAVLREGPPASRTDWEPTNPRTARRRDAFHSVAADETGEEEEEPIFTNSTPR